MRVHRVADESQLNYQRPCLVCIVCTRLHACIMSQGQPGKCIELLLPKPHGNKKEGARMSKQRTFSLFYIKMVAFLCRYHHHSFLSKVGGLFLESHLHTEANASALKFKSGRDLAFPSALPLFESISITRKHHHV